MKLARMNNLIFGWLSGWQGVDQSDRTRQRDQRDHVIIFDGTMSSVEPGRETHARTTLKLLRAVEGQHSIWYEAGIQWQDWRSVHNVLLGRGINRQIRRGYGFLASRYRPGDRIFLIGYSRGAFAARSLAGVIDRIGLLKPEHATERNIREAYRHYQRSPDSSYSRRFTKTHCHATAPIEVVAAWDTVKALGLRLPFQWRWSEPRHEFHDHQLSRSVKHGFQALALDETRMAFAPVLWTSTDEWTGRVEQVWFRGSHGDIGGQLGGYEPARPLANIPLVWMLSHLERCGLSLPEGWEAQFPCDPNAPSVGTWRGWGKLFLMRRRRSFGQDRSERLHPSVGSAAGTFS